MDALSTFPVSQFSYQRYEAPVESWDAAALEDIIFKYLRGDPLKSSVPTPLYSRNQTWPPSRPDFHVSPVTTTPTYKEHDRSFVHSSSSPIHSMFSDSSSMSGSVGPTTSPLWANINGTAPRHTPAEEEVNFPEMPALLAPAPQANLNRNCSLRRSSEVVRNPSRATSTSRRFSFGLASTSCSPAVEQAPIPNVPATYQRMQPKIKDLVFLPGFVISSLKSPISKSPGIPPELKISTFCSASPQLPPLAHPEHELSFPTTRPRCAEQEFQEYRDQSRQSATIPGRIGDFLKTLKEREISLSRQSMPVPSPSSPTSHLIPINRTSRKSMQIQIPAHVQRHSIQEVHVQTRNEKPRGMEQEFLQSLEAPQTAEPRYFYQRVQTLNIKLVGGEQATSRAQIQADLGSVPVQSVKVAAAPRSPSSPGVWFTKGFFAGRDGMQMKMTRRVPNFTKMEWIIESDSGSEIMKSFGHSNSLSCKTDFSDIDGAPIFTFQKRTGTTRVAETPNGTCVFTISNTLYASPYWTVNLGSDKATAGTAQWIARGDSSLQTVLVSWGSFQVGQISLESKAKKHTYILNLAPEVNYGIMAALAIVFDDLRTDEAC